MQITKIHTTGKDYLFCDCRDYEARSVAQRLLDRKRGIGADGLITAEKRDGGIDIRLFLPDGAEECASANALIAAAKYFYDTDGQRRTFLMRLGGVEYTVRLSVLGGRVTCGWLDLPPIKPRPMEQLKYYHGIRGEVLRSCIKNPRLSLYSLSGEHAVFMLESAYAVRSLALSDVCKRLCEVLFFGEKIDLHFAGISGENSINLRSWRSPKTELVSSGIGAVLASYAAREIGLADGERIMVKTLGGSYCTELDGYSPSLCAKCETVFYGEAM